MEDLSFQPLGDPTPMRFAGGYVILRAYGCSRCGQGFWVEDTPERGLSPGAHHCPHCGAVSQVP